MKLTVDCEITTELAHLQSNSALSLLLAKGNLTQVSQALEALVCEQFGLKINDDFSMAAVSAAADGIAVDKDYWLRADPVHFVMQRDSFSLSAPVPLLLMPEHAKQMLSSLNQHFNQDGLFFIMGQSGAWYVRASQIQHIKTSLPSMAMDKNVHQFMPEGLDSAKWKAVLNEVQMLLHEHPANVEREAKGQVAVNSIWLSGGGMMPSVVSALNEMDLVVAQSPLYQGLAKQAGIAYQETISLAELLKSNASYIRLQLPATHHLVEAWLNELLLALKAKKIKQLTLNLGYYEKCIVLEVTLLDLFKFWRKAKPVANYLTWLK